nr:BlaI/MecI/CopY family transcriptional regulator [uncultured Faecalimonas sp.]
MKKLPQISEAEYEVMKIIWKYAPINTNEITEKLTQTTSWSPKTIQTMIKRLTMKGALSYEKQGRIFVYSPLIEENEYVGQESSSFLKRYYNGDITAMLSSYMENDRLSDKEIDTLRSILAKGKGGSSYD